MVRRWLVLLPSRLEGLARRSRPSVNINSMVSLPLRGLRALGRRRTADGNLPDRLFQQFVPSRTDTLDGRLDHDIGYDADALRGTIVRIKHSNPADVRAEISRQGNGGDIPVGSGGGTADDDRARRGTKRHCRVFGLTLRDF